MPNSRAKGTPSSFAFRSQAAQSSAEMAMAEAPPRPWLLTYGRCDIERALGRRDGLRARGRRAARGTLAAARAEARLDAGGDPPAMSRIDDYAIIGDCRSAALVSRDGSIDWLCWPRFDSPSIFARIIDYQKGGYFSIRPKGDFKSSRRYLEATNVLETTFDTSRGTAKLIDLMPAMYEEEKRRSLTPFREILRRVECVKGEVPME